jgi:hypothetical protein
MMCDDHRPLENQTGQCLVPFKNKDGFTMTRFLSFLIILTCPGCIKQPNPQDTALRGEYDSAVESHKGHKALKWYSGVEICRIEGKARQSPALQAIYFVRRVVDSNGMEPASLAEAIIWRDQAGKWFTGRWQQTSGDLSEVKLTADYLRDGKSSVTFKEALDLLVERKKEGVR